MTITKSSIVLVQKPSLNFPHLGGKVFVGEILNQEFGSFEILPIYHYELERNIDGIWSFEVYEHFRGRGLARELFSMAIEVCDTLEIGLWVAESNSVAIHIYKSFGFRFVSDKVSRSLAGHNIDLKFMKGHKC